MCGSVAAAVCIAAAASTVGGSMYGPGPHEQDPPPQALLSPAMHGTLSRALMVLQGGPLGLWGPVATWVDESCDLLHELAAIGGAIEVRCAKGDASPSAQSAVCDISSSHRVAGGTVGGVLGACGAGGDAPLGA